MGPVRPAPERDVGAPLVYCAEVLGAEVAVWVGEGRADCGAVRACVEGLVVVAHSSERADSGDGLELGWAELVGRWLFIVVPILALLETGVCYAFVGSCLL